MSAARLGAVVWGLGVVGCTLSDTACGAGLRLSAGECVAPVEDAEVDGSASGSYGSAAEDGEVRIDASAVDLALGSLLVLDRTPAPALAETPTTAGCDVDAVALEAADGQHLAFASRVFASDLLDPFGQGVGLDAGATLGAPQSDGRLGTFASLGGSGGFVLLGFDATRAAVLGDRVRVFEVEESSPRDRSDRCGVWRCPGREVDLSVCVFLAEVADDAVVELR